MKTLFLPSEMNWIERDIRITPKTDRRIPELIRIHAEGSGLSTIKIRKPYWARRYQILENNEEVSVVPDENGYIIISLDFSHGADIYLRFFYEFHIIWTPDEPDPLRFECEGYTFVPICEVGMNPYHAYIICR